MLFSCIFMDFMDILHFICLRILRSGDFCSDHFIYFMLYGAQKCGNCGNCKIRVKLLKTFFCRERCLINVIELSLCFL